MTLLLVLVGVVLLVTGLVLSYRAMHRLAVTNRDVSEFPNEFGFRGGMALILIGSALGAIGVLII